MLVHSRKLNSILQGGVNKALTGIVGFFFFHNEVFVIMKKVCRLFFALCFGEITRRLTRLSPTVCDLVGKEN